jgi:hypothetical protein
MKKKIPKILKQKAKHDFVVNIDFVGQVLNENPKPSQFSTWFYF